MEKKNYIDKIARQKEEQVKRRADIFSLKKQIAENNKKVNERQKSYEAKELTVKIQDH